MSRESIYEIAYEMLNTTNVFSKDVSELRYINKDGKKQSLIALVKEQASQYSYKYRGKSEQNIQKAFDVVASAMTEYLESYPAPFSFKQRTRANFKRWLEKIQISYDVPDIELPKELSASRNEKHIGLAILKLLHPRKGTTVREMAAALDITPRAVQKDLIKLSSSPPDSKDDQDIRIRLGGQPLQAEIDTIKDPITGNEVNPKAYVTHNSVSPLVLQENIMQLATLLKSLCRQFWDYSDDSARIIAVDIWNQMTDYAQNKIKSHYTYDNKDLAYFIGMLDEDFPDGRMCPYHTERQMLDRLETPLPIDQALPSLMKVEKRTGIISLRDGRTIRAKRLLPATTADGNIAYEAVDPEGNHVIFTKEQVEEVEII